MAATILASPRFYQLLNQITSIKTLKQFWVTIKTTCVKSDLLCSQTRDYLFHIEKTPVSSYNLYFVGLAQAKGVNLKGKGRGNVKIVGLYNVPTYIPR